MITIDMEKDFGVRDVEISETEYNFWVASGASPWEEDGKFYIEVDAETGAIL